MANSKVAVSPEEMLLALDARIEAIKTTKAAIRYIYSMDPQNELLRGENSLVRQVQQERQTKGAKKTWGGTRNNSGRKPVRGNNKEMIFKVLAASDTPLSAVEIYNRMVARGWTTTSAKPKELVGTTVRAYALTGVLRRVGADFELAPTPSAPVEEEAVSDGI